MIKVPVFVILFVWFLCSCGSVGSDINTEVASVGKEFAESYFNFDLSRAKQLSTVESEKWLKFYASNVTDVDIKSLIEDGNGASCVGVDVEMLTDTTATVSCEMSGFLDNESLDAAPHIASDGLFVFNLVKRKGRWLVKMEGLPQNERQNRD